MKRSTRLSSPKDFASVYKGGRKTVAGGLRMFVLPGAGPATRVGFSVGGCKKAVDRNRIKRYLREAYRKREARVRTGLDIVVVARDHVRQWSFAEVDRALQALFTKGRLFR